MHLSEPDFETLRDRARDGEVAIGISRNVARQFFIRVARRDVIEAAGIDIAGQRLIVWAGLVASPVIMFVCCLAIADGFGFGAAVIIPLVGAFWAVITGLTYQHGNWIFASVVTALAITVAVAFPGDYTVPIGLFCASVWVHRMTFIAAQRYLQALLTDSYDIYERLADHVQIEDLARRG